MIERLHLAAVRTTEMHYRHVVQTTDKIVQFLQCFIKYLRKLNCSSIHKSYTYSLCYSIAPCRKLSSSSIQKRA